MRTDGKIVNRLNIFLVFVLVSVWIVFGVVLFALQYPTGPEYVFGKGVIFGMGVFSLSALGVTAVRTAYFHHSWHTLPVVRTNSGEE